MNLITIVALILFFDLVFAAPECAAKELQEAAPKTEAPAPSTSEGASGTSEAATEKPQEDAAPKTEAPKAETPAPSTSEGASGTEAPESGDDWITYLKTWVTKDLSVQDSEKYFEHALSLAKRDHDLDGEALLLTRLGVIKYEAEKYEEALQFYSQSLSVFKTIPEPNPKEFGMLMERMSRCARHLGKMKEAEELGALALDLSEKVHGKDSENYALNLRNMGFVYQHNEKFDQAIEYFSNAVEILKKLHGDSHELVKEMEGYLTDAKADKDKARSEAK